MRRADLIIFLMVSLGFAACKNSEDDIEKNNDTNFDSGIDAGDSGPVNDVDSGFGDDGGTSDLQSAGCGKGKPFDSLEEQTFDLNGESRKYAVYIPSKYTGETPLVPLFLFHGAGAQWHEDRKYFGINWEQTVKEKAIIVYAEAAKSRDWVWCAEKPEEECDDFDYFDILLKKIKDDFCVDPRKVIISGFSRGGGMVNSLRCLRPEKISGAAPVAGWQVHIDKCKKAIPVWMAHAQNDSAVPWEPTGGYTGGLDAFNAILKSNGCNGVDDYEKTGPYPDDTSDKWCRAYNGCDAPFTYCDHADDHHYPEWAPLAIWKFFF